MRKRNKINQLSVFNQVKRERLSSLAKHIHEEKL